MASIQTQERTTAVPTELRARRPRPWTQFWDYRTATWQVAASTVPTPRRGE